jgi:catechol 2,3-dioxygenase-like lactoylglutathione lyase family enzyme
MKQSARPARAARKTSAPRAKAKRTTKPRASARPRVHVSIDVPDLEAGLRFYQSVFGFAEVARPFATMAVLDAHNLTVCMHAKSAGSKPSPVGTDLRRYLRHWTPVHLDLHVQDFERVLEKVRAEGGLIEMEFREQGPMPAAFCSDPFGNGFCVLGEATRQHQPRR